jgi:hypothetical protein
MTMTLGKAGKQITNFPALPSARALALSKEISKKNSLPSARLRHLAKKLKKNSLPSAADVALGKEAVTVDGGFFFVKCLRGTRRVPDIWHSAKKPLPTDSLPSALCRVQ